MKEFLSEYQVERILEIIDFSLKYIQLNRYSKEKQRGELLKELRICLPELGKVFVDSKTPPLREDVCFHCLGTGKKPE